MPTDHTISALRHAFKAGASDEAARALLDSITAPPKADTDKQRQQTASVATSALTYRLARNLDTGTDGIPAAVVECFDKEALNYAKRRAVEWVDNPDTAPENVRAALLDKVEGAKGVAVVEACKHIGGNANDLYAGLQMRLNKALRDRGLDERQGRYGFDEGIAETIKRIEGKDSAVLSHYDTEAIDAALAKRDKRTRPTPTEPAAGQVWVNPEGGIARITDIEGGIIFWRTDEGESFQSSSNYLSDGIESGDLRYVGPIPTREDA